MLIKEYRIPLPLTVEEYRIAQLYMIAVIIAISQCRIDTHSKPCASDDYLFQVFQKLYISINRIVRSSRALGKLFKIYSKS